MHKPFVSFFDDSNALDEQHESAASPGDVHGLIARVED
jgi:hypothetical protein